QLDELAHELTRIESEHTDAVERIGGIKSEMTMLRGREKRERDALAEQSLEALSIARASYPQLRARAGQSQPDTVEKCDRLRDKLMTELNTAVEAAQREKNGYTTSIQQQMSEVLRLWPELAADMDASIDAIYEFRALHERLQ